MCKSLRIPRPQEIGERLLRLKHRIAESQLNEWDEIAKREIMVLWTKMGYGNAETWKKKAFIARSPSIPRSNFEGIQAFRVFWFP